MGNKNICSKASPLSIYIKSFIEEYQTLELDMKILSLLFVTAGLLVAVHGEENGEKEDIGTVIGIDLGTTYSW